MHKVDFKYQKPWPTTGWSFHPFAGEAGVNVDDLSTSKVAKDMASIVLLYVYLFKRCFRVSY